MHIRPTRRGRSRSLFLFIFFYRISMVVKNKGGKIIFSGDIFSIRFRPRDNQTRIIQIPSIVSALFIFLADFPSSLTTHSVGDVMGTRWIHAIMSYTIDCEPGGEKERMRTTSDDVIVVCHGNDFEYVTRSRVHPITSDEFSQVTHRGYTLYTLYIAYAYRKATWQTFTQTHKYV
jgi:hypothetical protein